MADITNLVDKAYEQMELTELADAPVEALQGLSDSDAQALKQALGIRTARQLAEHQFVRAVQAITLLAGAETTARRR